MHRVLVLGGGWSGLVAAIRVKSLYPAADVACVDRDFSGGLARGARDLFAIWIQSGYRYLPLRGENALALTLIVLGAQTAATALTVHLIHGEQ